MSLFNILTRHYSNKWLNRRAASTIAISAFIGTLPTVAFANWQYQVQESQFDGKKTKGGYTYSDTNNEALMVWAHPDTGEVAADAPIIVLNPNIQFICDSSSDGLMGVNYITFDSNGTKLREARARFDVSASNTTLSVRNAPNPSYNFGPALLAAMNEAAEIRFRFIDDCGTESVTKFSLSGFKDVVQKIRAEKP
ncbi:hypothetical protein ACCS66_03950 [Rhizobium ruizarguesonis]